MNNRFEKIGLLYDIWVVNLLEGKTLGSPDNAIVFRILGQLTGADYEMRWKWIKQFGERDKCIEAAVEKVEKVGLVDVGLLQDLYDRLFFNSLYAPDPYNHLKKRLLEWW
ncbi:hypothetical protein IMZ31_21740 (plasmid) [Pontibacillus sp. ALD_SL1]|uniref:hypothetical protein n=1 Tax=Pontibacillus sp. ALD_SL1 TaxID=2777185 RepID=UPI001A963AFB|nr:hypothetical protein [Pontibacillus sp. ALD_SL1]QST02075.1 hypothetical protein IMZ31_21740 [Pontibacillus sp. ALD_SL1]